MLCLVLLMKSIVAEMVIRPVENKPLPNDSNEERKKINACRSTRTHVRGEGYDRAKKPASSKVMSHDKTR